MDVNAPFGGYKNSGIGREFGREGLAEYMELKSDVQTNAEIAVARPDPAPGSPPQQVHGCS